MRLIDADNAKKHVNQLQTLKPSEKMLLRLALDRTPTYEPPNDPLTPEQLLELEGEPVWLGGSGLNRWDIFTGGLKGGFACFLRGALPMDGCGKTWAPYRRRPEPGNGKEKGR